jgi:Plants and Prokaryotes Conserved (PCC) domain
VRWDGSSAWRIDNTGTLIVADERWQCRQRPGSNRSMLCSNGSQRSPGRCYSRRNRCGCRPPATATRSSTPPRCCQRPLDGRAPSRSRHRVVSSPLVRLVNDRVEQRAKPIPRTGGQRLGQWRRLVNGRLSFVGDNTIDNREPKVHGHVVLDKADGTAPGGHILEGHVRPTLEIVITETPRHLFRRLDPGSGLALIDPTAAPKNQSTCRS